MKKLLAGLGFLALLTALLCGNVSAATDFVCPCCDKNYADCNWQPWTLKDGGTDNTLTADGHYYLTGDVTTIKSQVRIGDGTLTPKITLDLRGHTISGSQRAFGVYGGATLSVVDSVGGGVVSGKQAATSQVGGAIRVNDGATLNLYGGTVLDASENAHLANGAAIATEGKNVTINIAGGNVQGNQFAPRGGAIFAARNAIINISDGKITGGSAYLGGAIYADNVTLNITGGEVVGGTATEEGAAEGENAGFGGAIYACNNTVLTVSGGKITGGTAYNGAAVALMCAQMDVTGGEIVGGTARNYGAAIHLLADNLNEVAVPCTLNISGGKVTGQKDSGRATITIASNAHTVNISGGEIVGADKPNPGGAAVSGQGTAAIINITGGTITGAAKTSTSRSGVVYSRGLLNISDGTIEVTAGDGPAVYMYQNYGLLTVTGNAQTTIAGKVRLVDDAKVAGGSGALQFVNGITDGIWYQRGVDAVNNCPEGGFVRSFGGGILNLQKKTVYVDVNGQKLTIRNGTFYGFDSANDGYNASKCGTVTLDTANGGICGASSTAAPTGNTYVTVDDGTTLTFHRVDIQLPDVYLRTTAGKEGIYYGATLRADSAAITALKTYGVALTTHKLTGEADWSAAMDDTVKRSTYNPSELVGNKVNTLRSTSLVHILHKNNNTMQNNTNANTRVYARPYLELSDGTFLFGAEGSSTMRQVAQAADGQWNTLTDAQKQGLLGMYERFSTTLNRWPLENLLAAYQSGDPAVDALILDYRRDLVIAAMRAQLEVLWTVDKEVVYSKSSASLGPDADLARYKAAQEAAGKTYNPLNDQIITLYPDRIYQGLPYTHASTSLDALALYSDPDENGVLNIRNATTSLFSGGSESGSEVDKTTGERIGQFNVARIGNDCWDMVHYAWGQLTGSITTSSTRELTPSYGIQWIGQDILTKAMRDNGYVSPIGYDMSLADSNLIDCICVKNSKGLYVFRSISETDAAGNPIADHDVDGTRLVRYGTRTDTGTKDSKGNPIYDYQAMYQTYAMVQPGDGMVQWRNTGGHAMMIVGINVVYDAAGKIDGNKSTVELLEQGSGHEERQSRLVSEFDTAVTAKHSSHSSTNNNCLYCAGYTDQVIDGKHVWKMDYCDNQTRTFKQMAEGDCLAITCQALQTVTKPTVARVSVDKAGHGFTGMLTGRLTASYRVSSVNLDITGANKSFHCDLITIQSAVSQYTALSRFLTDSTCGIGDSSVLTRDLPLYTDENGAVMADTAKLPEGVYSYTFSCTLNPGHQIELRSGTFRVSADGTIVENPVSDYVPSNPEE